MATSGTFNFALTNTSILFEAFDRIQIDPELITPRQMVSARVSLNLELETWDNEGFNFWKTTSGTIPLLNNQETYTLPTNLSVLTELWYSQVNALGTGVNQDRIMVPMTRSDYAFITNKLQPGLPTRYWLQMTIPQQITIWEVPQAGAVAPNVVLNWFGLQQIQDANTGGTETPDIPYRAIEALCAKMALRLCEKFGPKDPQARQQLMLEKKTIADSAWNNMARRDQEPGDMIIRPNVGVYGRLL